MKTQNPCSASPADSARLNVRSSEPTFATAPQLQVTHTLIRSSGRQDTTLFNRPSCANPPQVRTNGSRGFRTPGRDDFHGVPNFSLYGTRRKQGLTFSQSIDPVPTPEFLYPATNPLSSSEFPVSFFPLPDTRETNVEKPSPNPLSTASFRLTTQKYFALPDLALGRHSAFPFPICSSLRQRAAVKNPNRHSAIENRQCLESTNFPRISGPSFLDFPRFSASRAKKTFPSETRSRHFAKSPIHPFPSVISVSFSSARSVSLRTSSAESTNFPRKKARFSASFRETRRNFSSLAPAARQQVCRNQLKSKTQYRFYSVASLSNASPQCRLAFRLDPGPFEGNKSPMGNLTVGFLGAGKMASALASGFVRAGLVAKENIIASDLSPAARQHFAEASGGKTTGANSEVVKAASVMVLAVKPDQASDVLKEINSSFSENQLLVSIAAGLTLARLESGLPPGSRVVRVMPNTPALVGASASAFALGESATTEDGDLVSHLFSSVGLAFQVKESLLDAVTGLSGSGPAYVYLMIEALSDGGVAAGLPRDIAIQLAAQTVLGGAKMVLETRQHPGALKDMVTSPGGTTIEGIHELEKAGVRAGLINAVRSAAEKSRKLGQG